MKGIMILLGLIMMMMMVGGCSGAGLEQFDTSKLEAVTETMQKPIYPLKRAELQVGDGLTISFMYHPELNTSVVVGLDGVVFLPLMGRYMAAGKTTAEIHRELVAFYSRDLKSPDISITTDQPDPMVFVAGEVRAGGPLPFRTYMTVAQALTSALPNMVDGDITSVILIRKDEKDPETYTSYLVNGDFAEGNSRNIYLAPGDVMIVPRKGIVLAGDAVRQYIEDMVPFQMNLSYGFVHELFADDQNIQYVNPTTGAPQ